MTEERTHREATMQQCYQIPGQCWPVELGWLYDTFSKSRSHAEIGTYCGKSLIASCAAMEPQSLVVSIDNRSNGWRLVDTTWLTAVHDATLRLLGHLDLAELVMHSIDAARQCMQLGYRFDSVYIDGCHQYAECKADIEVWSTLLKPGGIIAGHDYWPRHIGVMEAVNDAFEGKHEVVAGTRIWFWTKPIE